MGEDFIKFGKFRGEEMKLGFFLAGRSGSLSYYRLRVQSCCHTIYLLSLSLLERELKAVSRKALQRSELEARRSEYNQNEREHDGRGRKNSKQQIGVVE